MEIDQLRALEDALMGAEIAVHTVSGSRYLGKLLPTADTAKAWTMVLTAGGRHIVIAYEAIEAVEFAYNPK